MQFYFDKVDKNKYLVHLNNMPPWKLDLFMELPGQNEHFFLSWVDKISRATPLLVRLLLDNNK